MTDRPILFSAPMVRAIIREIEHPGTGKTQTRRVYAPGHHTLTMPPSPRYAVGDRLWVREAWRVSRRWDDTPPRDLPERKMSVVLEAGGSIANHGDPLRWIPSDWPGAGMPEWIGRVRPGIHMPRWASRLTLTVTEVRVQRLQDISEADAKAEGCSANAPIPGDPYPDWSQVYGAIDAYEHLWDSINADRAPWDSNPWVCAITFKTALGNIDQTRSAGC